jgi:hypothetical protein
MDPCPGFSLCAHVQRFTNKIWQSWIVQGEHLGARVAICWQPYALSSHSAWRERDTAPRQALLYLFLRGARSVLRMLLSPNYGAIQQQSKRMSDARVRARSCASRSNFLACCTALTRRYENEAPREPRDSTSTVLIPFIFPGEQDVSLVLISTGKERNQ